MKKVKNKLRVLHLPQIPCKAFKIEVADEIEAKRVRDILAFQHLWLLKNNFIPDYSNVILVEMFGTDGDGNPDWEDYYNEEEGMDFDEFEEAYLNEYTPITNYEEKIKP